MEASEGLLPGCDADLERMCPFASPSRDVAAGKKPNSVPSGASMPVLDFEDCLDMLKDSLELVGKPSSRGRMMVSGLGDRRRWEMVPLSVVGLISLEEVLEALDTFLEPFGRMSSATLGRRFAVFSGAASSGRLMGSLL
jgi:hypothetical protein